MNQLDKQRLIKNKDFMDYYWKNQDYRLKKRQRMREYMMDRRIKLGCWGSINTIIKIIEGC